MSQERPEEKPAPVVARRRSRWVQKSVPLPVLLPVLLIMALLVVPPIRDTVTSVPGQVEKLSNPKATAEPELRTSQRRATEHALRRVYNNTLALVKQAAEQQTQQTGKAVPDLENKLNLIAETNKKIRKAAFLTLAALYGESGDQATRYATEAESQADAPLAQEDAPLLAPTLQLLVEQAAGQMLSVANQVVAAQLGTPTPAPTSQPVVPGSLPKGSPIPGVKP